MKYVVLAIVLGINFQTSAQEKKIVIGPSANQKEVIHPKASVVGIEPKIDAYVKQFRDLDLFSGVVLIAKKGNSVYHKGFGLANIEKEIPVSVNSVFDIGSMNKAFTKVIIHNLIVDGKLKSDDNLGQYLKGFSKVPAEQVTIQHLLDHTSGFQDYHSYEYMQLPADEKSLDVIVEIAKNQELLFEPGKDNYYSNVGYSLLGAIVESVVGKSYYAVVQEEIIEKLKLKNTYLDKKYTVPNRAIGYESNSLGVLKNTDYLKLRPTPAGSFMSTASDMSKFFHSYYYGDKIWNDDARKLSQMEAELIENVKKNGSAPMIAGGFAGVNTVSFEILRDEISVLVLANRNAPVAIEIGSGILDILRGVEPMPAELPMQQKMATTYFEKGIDSLKTNFESFFEKRMTRMPKDAFLNEIGYDLLFSNQIDDAINIFKLNTELFSDSANTWDSYGEALLAQGKKEEALAAYKKALSIRPDLPSAIEKVKELSK